MAGALDVLRLLDVAGLLNVLGVVGFDALGLLELLGPLNALGLLNVPGLLSGLGLLNGLGLFKVLGLLSELAPGRSGLRARAGPPRPLLMFGPAAVPPGVAGLMSIGVSVELREPLDNDDVPVASDEADEPAGEAGVQFTLGVVVGDDTCANAGVPLQASAHASPRA